MNGHAEQGMRAKVNIPLLIACYSCGGSLLSVPSVIWDIFPVSAYGTFKYAFFFSLSFITSSNTFSHGCWVLRGVNLLLF